VTGARASGLSPRHALERFVTQSTRRRLLCLVVLAAVTLPPEWLLYRTVASSRVPLEQAWVNSLTSQERVESAQRIAEYPVAYRRALITTLPAADAAQVWVRTVDAFVARHGKLSAHQTDLLQQTRALATRTSIGPRTDIQPIADELRRELGESAYREIFFTAGPTTDRSAVRTPPLPLKIRIQAMLRDKFIVSASAPSCNCETRYPNDCGGAYPTCCQRRAKI
jgi:hypothetical protein